MDKELIFTGAYRNKNWFYDKYYFSGSNFRYNSFATVLNLLNQHHPNPTIIETGCQRMVDDIGGGMSSSIFAEYIKRYGGKLISVDISQTNLDCAKKCTEEIQSGLSTNFVCSDSIKFLKEYEGASDLLYLDSLDYPYGTLLNKYGGMRNIEAAEKALWEMEPDELLKEFAPNIRECQEHCVEEFLAIESKLQLNTILLIDDNLFPGGGKPRLLKELLPEKGWTCLIDNQQTLWVRKI